MWRSKRKRFSVFEGLEGRQGCWCVLRGSVGGWRWSRGVDRRALGPDSISNVVRNTEGLKQGTSLLENILWARCEEWCTENQEKQCGGECTEPARCYLDCGGEGWGGEKRRPQDAIWEWRGYHFLIDGYRRGRKVRSKGWFLDLCPEQLGEFHFHIRRQDLLTGSRCITLSQSFWLSSLRYITHSTELLNQLFLQWVGWWPPQNYVDILIPGP